MGLHFKVWGLSKRDLLYYHENSAMVSSRMFPLGLVVRAFSKVKNEFLPSFHNIKNNQISYDYETTGENSTNRPRTMAHFWM